MYTNYNHSDERGRYRNFNQPKISFLTLNDEASEGDYDDDDDCGSADCGDKTKKGES
jgi:hypothetical protein